MFSVAAFRLTTAANYAWSGLIDWRNAVEFMVGSALGGLLGVALATRIASSRRALTTLFAGIVFAVAGYMLDRTVAAGGLL